VANPLRAVATRIGRWPVWLKVASIVVVVLVVGAGLAVPVTLFLRGRPAASVARATATPTPVPLVSPSSGNDSLIADLTCRLPISSGAPGSGGFVGFPSAAFTSDPGSNLGTAIGRYSGGGSITYDRAANIWVPAPRVAVTPDGARFVYWSGPEADFHLVNVATSAETAIGPRLSGQAWQAASAARQNWYSGGPPWGLIEAGADGVYAVPPYGSTVGGLWLFPYAGGERQIASFGYWQAVGGGAAWGTRAPSFPQGATVAIVRLDLGSGASADWFSQDGENAVVEGFDTAGHPVVVTSRESDYQVWVVDGQRHGTQVLNLPREQARSGYGSDVPVQSVIGDANGVWMATADGLYLYRNGRTQKVSTVTGQLGGGCAS
jgi:hypothetical protein